MKTIYDLSLEKHALWQGKIETALKIPLETRQDLSLAYTPGVAEASRQIAKNGTPDSYKYTSRGNTIAVVSDGSAVLGLGDIGPLAALPVMEGKAALFKRFAGINAFPLCIDTKDTQKIIEFCKQIAPSFGGINLEDISAPRCVEIERTLIKELDIPVFHDDQHGTAIVLAAAVINALEVAGKKAQDITAVVSGTGAAGSSVIHILCALGVQNIYGFNINGIVLKQDYDKYDFLTKELSLITNKDNKRLSLVQAMAQADIFIGVSAPGIVSKDMVRSMKKNAIVFAMANPEPEITYEAAKEAGAFIVGTGRSDFPNQINNLLAFPGLFKGALDAGAKKIVESMKLSAAKALADLVPRQKLSPDMIIPSVFDSNVVPTVAKAVAQEAKRQGLCR